MNGRAGVVAVSPSRCLALDSGPPPIRVKLKIGQTAGTTPARASQQASKQQSNIKRKALEGPSVMNACRNYQNFDVDLGRYDELERLPCLRRW